MGAGLIYVLVFLGGTAALSWEIVWQLQASLAFGVSALGTALTLAVTLGGFGVGSLCAGRWLASRPLRHPLRAYGALEALIGGSGLWMLPGFRALESLDASLYAWSPAWGPWLQGPAIALLLAPATLAMGASVPVFQQIAQRHAVRISTLYASNTAGAAAGVLGMSFALMPALGVSRTVLCIAGVNLAVAAIAMLPRSVGVHAPEEESATAGLPILSRQQALWLVACTGFATFALEVAWFRALRTAFWSTVATFAITLAAVLIPLALGARWVPWLRTRGWRPTTLLMAAGVATLLATPLIERMDLVTQVAGSQAWVTTRWFLTSLLLVSPAVLCLATVLPWCLEAFPESGFTGRLYAVNTFASVVGSLVAAWLLLPVLGFARSAWLVGVLVIAVATLVGARPRWQGLTAAAVSLALAAAFASSPGRDRLYRSGKSQERIVAHAEGPDFTTSVLESPSGRRRLLIDGFSATSEDWFSHYMVWMGSLPAVLHPSPETGLVICFGTGQTANALRHEGLRAVDLVDVSPAVFELAPLFRSNSAVLDDPRVTPVVMDGRAWLRRNERGYDVITLEPMPPNFAGVNSLYSREFYEIVSERLAPGGVVAQWLPIHLVTPEHAASIAATFAAVFPDSVIWMDPISPTGILLGRRESGDRALGQEWPGLSRRQPERLTTLSAEEIRRSLWLDGKALRRFAEGHPLITDDNQLLQYSALRAGMDGTRSRRVLRENMERLGAAAGREAYARPRPR
ncbi:MAG: fused MFS/spermidine synthase [Myxococcota bacterium]